MRLIPSIVAGLLWWGATILPAQQADLDRPVARPWIGIDFTTLEVDTVDLIFQAIGCSTAGDFDRIARAADLLDEPSEREVIRWTIACRLAEVPSDAAVPLLSRLASEPEEVMVWEPGCRRGEFVPKWPVRATASLVLEQLEVRRLADSLKNKSDQIAELLGQPEMSERVQRAVLELASLDRECALLVRDRVGSAEGLDLRREWILAEVLLLLGEVPTEAEFARLSAEGRWRLFERRAVFPGDELQKLETLLLEEPAIAARIKKERRTSIRELLESGPDGAVAASRERCAAWTESLNELIDDAEVRDQAVLALMLQDTDLARRTLIDAASAGRVSSDQQRKVMRWAGR
jgi:hypothetical protein